MKYWYEAKTGNDQGPIIEEKTGKNIAVCYDKIHGSLIASAPDLLEACKRMLSALDDGECLTRQDALKGILRNAISKAEAWEV